jgi:hypothetical protein
MRVAWLILGIVIATPVAAAPRDYLGAAACGQCHAPALAAWEKSARAGASAPEVLVERGRDPACLACHATGDGASVASLLPGVQCEACHGGGAAYAVDDIMRDPPLARALGLRDLEADLAAVCARCHRPGAGTRAAKFDAAAAWTKIQH